MIDKRLIFVWLSLLMFSLAFWAVVIFVAVHFLSKVW